MEHEAIKLMTVSGENIKFLRESEHLTGTAGDLEIFWDKCTIEVKTSGSFRFFGNVFQKLGKIF